MKSGISLILLLQLIIAPASGQNIFTLDQAWFFTKADSIEWLPCTIPGNNFTALFENQKIPDPYYGDHENQLQWVNESGCWFKTYFELSEAYLLNEHIELVCPGLDTYASVYLNQEFIANTNNAFRNWTFDIKRKLKPGRNELVIKFQPAESVSQQYYNQLEIKLPGESRVMTRKPQYQFGWDFSPKFVSCGLPQTVYLNTWNAIKLYEASIQTLSVSDSLAELKLNARIFIHDTQVPFDLQLQIGSEIFRFTLSKVYGMQNIKRYFALKSPQLWWPNGSGNSHLYPVTLRIFQKEELLSEKKWKTGIRTIELISEFDPKGQSFTFQINGKKIFCKGSNYVPADMLYNQQEKKSALIAAAKSSHFNMLRVWGGGQYESDAFYEACDEAGIMIWQDFMFACGMYPGDSSFLENVRIEAEEQVERLSKYACLALWCGNNEISEGWHRWGWQDEIPLTHRKKIWSDYQQLFESILPDAVENYSSNTSYWSSSPLFGRGDNRFQRNGDAHDWGLWHDGMSFAALENRVPRFMSEFGFQSWPSLFTIQQFAGESLKELEKLQLANSHQKHNRGNAIIAKYLQNEFPEPTDLDAWIYLNQLMQAEGMCSIVKSHRLAKPYCMGSLYWQLNDCWPGISWSGIDYYGRWKAIQHKLKTAFAPVVCVAKTDGDSLHIYAISDLQEQEWVQCDIFFQDFSGNIIFYDRWEGFLRANQSDKIYSKRLPFAKLDFGETHYILLHWTYEDQKFSDVSFFKPFKILNLEDPEISILKTTKTADGHQLIMMSNNFAKSTALSLDAETEFFPNYFDMNPGEKISVDCKTKKESLDISKIKIVSLFDFLKSAKE